MDRRLLFPAIVVTASAQQVSPATAKAEKAVRARAEKFLHLEQEKKFRDAWALVAKDTQDYFFNTGRPEIQSFTIDGVELSNHNTRARVTFRIKRTMPIPGMSGQTFELNGVSTWKLENGDWYWYVDQSAVETPFGKIPVNKATAGGAPAMPGIPNLASLKAQVLIDKNAVTLSEASPVQNVVISNHMPGSVTIEIQATKIDGLIVDLDNKQLGSQKDATVSFRAKPGTRPAGTVGINVLPLGQHFDVKISSN